MTNTVTRKKNSLANIFFAGKTHSDHSVLFIYKLIADKIRKYYLLNNFLHILTVFDEMTNIIEKKIVNNWNI